MSTKNRKARHLLLSICIQLVCRVNIQVSAQQFKCRIDSGSGANVMSLDDYKKVNPSEFDEVGNSLVGFSNDRTTLKAYGQKTIKQYGVRALNCQWDNKLMTNIWYCRGQRTHIARITNIKENGAVPETLQGLHRAHRHTSNTTKQPGQVCNRWWYV